MSLGAGLGRLKGRVFRIGHLGDFNDLMAGRHARRRGDRSRRRRVPFTRGGITAALDFLLVVQAFRLANTADLKVRITP